MTRLDVFLLSPSANLSHSASLESRRQCVEPPLVWLGLVTYLLLRTELSRTPFGLVAKPNSRLQIVRNSPNSLSTVQDTSIVIGPLCIFDVMYADEARYVRFCLVTVVCGQKHVVNVYDDHSDEMSRKVAQAEEGRVQFERCPGVSFKRVTQFFPPSTGRIGHSKNTFHNLDQSSLFDSRQAT